ncbi:MAG: hypothetical protein AB4050_16565 [Synechococcus sp.]
MSIQRRLQSCMAAGLALSLPLTAVSVVLPQSQQHKVFAANDVNQEEPNLVKAIDFVQENETIRMVIYLSGQHDSEVLFTQTDSEWVGTVAHATLELPNGSQAYSEENPIDGVSKITAIQVDDNSVEIRLTGSTQVPDGSLTNRSAEQIMFEFAGLASASSELAMAPDANSASLDIQPDEILANSLPAAASGQIASSSTSEASPSGEANESISATEPPLATSEVSESPPDLFDIVDIDQESDASLEESSSPGPIETAAAPTPIPYPINNETPTTRYLDNGLLSPIDTYLNQTSANSEVSTISTPDEISAAPTQVFQTPGSPAVTFDDTSNTLAVTPSTDPRVPTPIPENNPSPTLNITAAAAPPIGDIVTGDIVLTAPAVELGSREQVTLTLKDAPVADVLSLLVRRAGLDVVLNDVPAGSTISLDVADSPLQTVFNSVLRLNELQAERVGRTLFIGTSLPGVQQETLRTFRLNQAYVNDTTLAFGGITPSIGETNTVSGEDIEIVGILNTLEEFAGEGGPFAGVQFYGDERTNSITAVGTPNQLDLVAAKIAQLDVRNRQAVIDFKLIDFLIGDDFTLSTEGFAGAGQFGIGTGASNPPADTFDASSGEPGQDGIIDSRPIVSGPSGLNFSFDTVLNNFTDPLGTLDIQALVVNTRSKILADPKVLVSDGGYTTIAIGDEVITNVEITTDPATLLTTETAVIGNAGVSLSVRNVRIDDNGFVSLDLSPQVSSPASQEQLGETTITLLSQRTLNTQQIRLRDGQTFVLSGLIQDSDLVSVEKVPILGDIPLLGFLFRQERIDNDRREVVLLMTPHIVKDS